MEKVAAHLRHANSRLWWGGTNPTRWEVAGLIICLVCGEQSTTPTSHCGKCGASLPRLDYASAAANRGVGKLTGRYNQFSDAVVKTKSGEWSAEDFANWLQGISNALSDKASYLVNLIYQSGYYDYQMEEVELCLTGVEDYETGIEQLWQYVNGGEVDLLDQALEAVWEGNEKINEAMRLNREFRRGLEEEWGYM